MGALGFRCVIETKGLVAAAQIVNPDCATEDEARVLIRLYVEGLLAQDKKVSAGIVLWGEKIFNMRPAVVQTNWRALDKSQCVIVPGGASEGKTYTAVTWLMLRWWQDPGGTTIKVISTTGKHTESNIFGTMKRLHELACVPMPGVLGADAIAFKEGDKRFGVQIVRIKAGEDNSEVLQGFHPLPRPDVHPLFGDMTATMVALDEAEGIPNGVWTGVANMKASGDAKHVKCFAFYNPKDITAPPAQYAEPVGGWGEFDVETGVRGSDEWISAKGWHVVRIDPKKTENVQQRREVYPGFQTYEAYREYEEKDGGNSQHYYVFGRGAYPPDSAINTVTPQRVLGLMRGEFLFSGGTANYGAADIAIDGRDEAVFSVGRYGLARAFQRIVRGPDGKLGTQLITFRKERMAAQLDQQFSMKKGSTEIVAAEIKKHCLRLQIPPENFMCDATGNGEPVYLLLRTEAVWSPKVRGIRFGEDATNLKVLDEDTQLANEQYDGLVSEVLFALTRWGEFGYLAIAPSVNSEKLEPDLGGRRYVLGPGQTLRVEDKKEFKKRLGRSPDHGDSFSIWLHGIRTKAKGADRPSMTDKQTKEKRGLQFDPTEIDTVQWLPGGI